MLNIRKKNADFFLNNLPITYRGAQMNTSEKSKATTKNKMFTIEDLIKKKDYKILSADKKETYFSLINDPSGRYNLHGAVSLQKLAFMSVTRRKSGFFHPLNTTNSANNLLNIINNQIFGNGIREIILGGKEDRKIRMRDLRAFARYGAEGVNNTSKSLFFNNYDKDNERFFSVKDRGKGQKDIKCFFNSYSESKKQNSQFTPNT